MNFFFSSIKQRFLFFKYSTELFIRRLFTRSFFIGLLSLLVIIASLAFIFRDRVKYLYDSYFAPVQKNVEDKIQEVILPIQSNVQKGAGSEGPLVAKTNAPSSFLSVDGVIKFTNENRVKNGLKPLSANTKLNQSALIKAKDMFDRQYFEHDSPDGLGAGDLAKEVGYQFIVIGENLATGNFFNDAELVQGWMNSPGHRANILNSNYKEIGVSVLRGVYEGRNTWMAVQHFGRPISDCPQPDYNLKKDIDANETKLELMAVDLKARKRELESMSPNDPNYNQKVDEYNALVNAYNSLLETTKSQINTFNAQFDSFKSCADS